MDLHLTVCWKPVSTHMPLARHDFSEPVTQVYFLVSTHMPLARHDNARNRPNTQHNVSTHMPLARHDRVFRSLMPKSIVSTHMPLARHDNFYMGLRIGELAFLLTCLLRGMTVPINYDRFGFYVSTHMPLARHDVTVVHPLRQVTVSTHMPLARHDPGRYGRLYISESFYSHASCEA